MQLDLLEWVGCNSKVQANHQTPAADREYRTRSENGQVKILPVDE
jgi:hypothetical protein